MEVASALDLAATDASVLHASNKLTVLLQPCDVVARVAFAGREALQAELEIARQLADIGSPVARPEPRVEPCVHERDGFAVTLWTHYAQSRELAPPDYADALARLHAGMARVEITAPHFTDRVTAARRLVESPRRTPDLGEADRELLRRALDDPPRATGEQLLHGEPHPGNVLMSERGPVFIDFETCCRGPVEFDVAHVPEAVSERYPGFDRDLLQECRLLVIAMVAAWRWDPGDRFPHRDRARQALLGAMRSGPPWPALDAVMTAGG